MPLHDLSMYVTIVSVIAYTIWIMHYIQSIVDVAVTYIPSMVIVTVASIALYGEYDGGMYSSVWWMLL